MPPTFETKIRSYGWYCSKCGERKTIDKVWVAKVRQESRWSNKGYVGIICADCNTELLDCFVAKKYYPEIRKQCETCEDRFQCFTMSEAQIEKPMKLVHPQEIHSHVPLDNENEVVGIRSYTGKIYDKLEQKDFCAYPERDDCNHSWMRANYNDRPYRRCRYMKYDKQNKEWYCEYGRKIRG